jgi:ribosome-binding ATPase
MSLRIGIVGLPNVGKSTLFNALTNSRSAEAQNYPFCTIDPNVGIVEVPDNRLDTLAKIVHPQKVIPATVEFVDIAGLVKDAHKGEGLGNQFLASIREVHAICHLVRGFENDDIHHVEGSIDPKRDRETIETELELADLQMTEKKKDKRAKEELLPLLRKKPVIYALNVAEDELKSVTANSARERLSLPQDAHVIVLSAKIEEDLQDLDQADAENYLQELGVKSSGLDSLIREAYSLLGYITFFTAGPKEVRAWQVIKGSSAPQAAGVIHTDFQEGFIRAETIAYNDFTENKGEQGAKEKGKLRVEGKEYIVQDGDIMHFRFNV